MKAILNFVTPRNDGTVPFLLDTHWTGTHPRKVPVDMHDARDVASQLSLGREGFRVEKVNCEGVDYNDPVSMQTRWIPAVRDVIQRATGGSFVTLFGGPLVRFSNSSPRSGESTVSAPARAVHSDLWAEYGYADIPGSPVADIAAQELRERYGDTPPARWKIFNFWQMISPPPQDTPLAVCALDSVTADDLIVGRGRFCPEDGPPPPLPEPGEECNAPITFFRENPVHRWYYVSNMMPGEALLFQTLDPEAGPLKGRVPHCAFDMEPRPANAVSRNSVEIRAFVAYD